MNKIAVIILPLALIAILGAIFLFLKYLPEEKTSLPEKIEFKSETVPAKRIDGGWTRGVEQASLELIEFANFSCPACAAYAPILNQLLKNIPELKITYKHFPFSYHKNDIPAAMAAEAAGEQGKFAEMAELLYARQDEWVNSRNNEIFIRYAEALGLDIEKFKKDLDNSELKTRILTNLSEANQRQLNATPTFFLNGKKIEFPPEYTQAYKIITSAAKK
jgi:protein-disulfide isomerase